MVGDDLQAARGDDHAGVLGDQDDLVGRRLLPPAVLIQPGGQEDLEGSAEVEHLDLGEDQDTDTAEVHG
jgi:hypothetical protein